MVWEKWSLTVPRGIVCSRAVATAFSLSLEVLGKKLVFPPRTNYSAGDSKDNENWGSQTPEIASAVGSSSQNTWMHLVSHCRCENWNSKSESKWYQKWVSWYGKMISYRPPRISLFLGRSRRLLSWLWKWWERSSISPLETNYSAGDSKGYENWGSQNLKSRQLGGRPLKIRECIL